MKDLPESERLPGSLENWGKGLIGVFGAVILTTAVSKENTVPTVDYLELTAPDGKTTSTAVRNARISNGANENYRTLNVIFMDASHGEEKQFKAKDGYSWEISHECATLEEYEAEILSEKIKKQNHSHETDQERPTVERDGTMVRQALTHELN